MLKKLLLIALLAMSMSVFAEVRTIDISGNNTSSSYVSYSQSISLPASDTVNVKMARYCYFSSSVSGTGVLNLYAGGERCYLGTEKGKAWPVWVSYKGDVLTGVITSSSDFIKTKASRKSPFFIFSSISFC